MTDSIFDGSTEPVVETPAVSSTPTLNIPTEIAELVGEGKKYKSVEDALKSVPHSQKHIQTLEAEAAQMKLELEKRRTAEDILEELKGGLKQDDGLPPKSEFDPSRIEQVVADLLSRKENQSTAKNNVDLVVNTFTSTFGDKVKAEEAFVRLAEEAGMSVPMLNQLAATSPNAVLKLAGITKKATESTPTKTSSTVNTEAYAKPQQGELSAKVPNVGATTKDLVQAWKNAGEKVKQRNS